MMRHALRRLRLSPLFVAFAVGSLACGLTASVATYSIISSVFWPASETPNAHELLTVSRGNSALGVSWPDFQDIARQQRSFENITAVAPFRATVFVAGASDSLLGEAVSNNYFKVVQSRATSGRLFGSGDDAARRVVVSDRYWRKAAFRGASIGAVVRIAGDAYEIVGVVGGHFRGLEPQRSVDLWIPAEVAPVNATWLRRVPDLYDRGSASFAIWGRLRQGLSRDAGREDLALIGKRLDTAFPQGMGRAREWSTVVDAGHIGISPALDSLPALVLLCVAAAATIAISNVASLSRGRGWARVAELKTRRLLGASRWRLVRELLCESAILNMSGLALSVVAMRVLSQKLGFDLPVAPGEFVHVRLEMSWSTIQALGLMSMCSFVVSGLWPALALTGDKVLHRNGSTQTIADSSWSLHKRLVVWQVGASFGLFLISALCVAAVAGAQRRKSGIADIQLSIISLDRRSNGVTQSDWQSAMNELLTETRTQPGIISAAVSDGLPYGLLIPFRETLRTVGYSQSEESITTYVIRSSPDFADTVGLEMVAGKWFDESDEVPAATRCVLSEQLATRLFGTAGAGVVGKQILMGSLAARATLLTVIGVTKETDTFSRGRRGDNLMFLPYSVQIAQRPSLPTLVLVRSTNPGKGTEQVERIVRRRHPNYAPTLVGTGTDVLEGPYVILRLLTIASTVLGVVVLILAMVGLFAVLSQAVARRTREIGVRMAVGARPQDILTLIIGDGLQPVVSGIALGFFVGLSVAVILRSIIVIGVPSIDLRLVFLVISVFLLVGMTASCIPAIRAANVQPNEAVREQ